MELAIKKQEENCRNREEQVIHSEAGKSLPYSQNKRNPKWYEIMRLENLACHRAPSYGALHKFYSKRTEDHLNIQCLYLFTF